MGDARLCVNPFLPTVGSKNKALSVACRTSFSSYFFMPVIGDFLCPLMGDLAWRHPH